MKLALRLGKSLQELDESMNASEFYLWVAYDQISPIGDERADIHAAQVSAAVYQSQGAKIKISDAVIKWDQKPVSAAEKMKQSLQRLKIKQRENSNGR